MKKGLKLSTKLVIGFGLALLLTIIIAIVSIFGLTMATNGFVEYRALARETNEAGRIQANMLKAEINVEKFIETGDKKYVNDYKEAKELMLTLIKEGRDLIKNEERLGDLKLIEDEFTTYDKTFNELQTLYEERDNLVYNIVNVYGHEMVAGLTELMDILESQQEYEKAYYVGRVQERILLGRIYTAKYLDTNGNKEMKRARLELETEFDNVIGDLRTSLTGTTYMNTLNDVVKRKNEYIDGLVRLEEIIKTRNDLIENQLNRIGPLIADIVEEMKLEVKERQDIVGPQLQSTNQMIITVVVVVALFSILIAILIAIIIIRSVNKQLGGDPGYLASIANTISKGILTFDSLHDGKKKVGLFADMIYMTETLEKKSEMIREIADGNLTIDVELASKDDEVGNSLVKMVDKLNEIIKQVNVSVEQISEGSSQVSDSSQSLSQGSSEQASSLEEITASLNQISSQIQANTEGAVNTNKLAEDTLQNSIKGNNQMDELVKAMDDVNKSANDIKNIVKIIDDIAFQTNLLALNADIEAARVGKYGKGFAVVANSVRNLASKSQKSVKETTGMVEETLRNIERGSNLVVLTSKQLADIKESSQDVASISNEVSESSQEQARGIEQISTGLGQIEEVVQSNSANAEENAAASEELSAQVTRLKELVSYFNIKKENMLESFDSQRSNKKTDKKETKELLPVKDDE